MVLPLTVFSCMCVVSVCRSCLVWFGLEYSAGSDAVMVFQRASLPSLLSNPQDCVRQRGRALTAR